MRFDLPPSSRFRFFRFSQAISIDTSMRYLERHGLRTASTGKFPKEKYSVRIFLGLATMSATVSLLISLFPLLTYRFGSEPPWIIMYHGPGMSPLTAMALWTASLATITIRTSRASRISSVLPQVTLVIGALRLVNAAWCQGLLSLLAHVVTAWAHYPTLAPNTAATLVLLAIAILALNKMWHTVSQCAASLAAILPSVALVGYLEHAPTLHGPMALPAATGTLLCSVAILCHSAHKYPLRAVLSRNLAGRIARVQLLVLVGLSLAIGGASGFFSAQKSPERLMYAAVVMTIATIIAVSIGAHWHERIDRRRRRAESAVLSLATEDPLTGLFNRRGFFDACLQCLAQPDFQDSTIGVLMIDIDHFKSMNDSAGHQAGDETLRRLGRVLVRNLRPTDIIGRLGGDEFALILPGMDAKQCLAMGEKLRRVAKEIDVQDLPGVNTVVLSVGVAEGTIGRCRLEELLSKSDLAMYLAKSAGRDRCEFYREDIASRMVELKELENDLKDAWKRGELFVVYQPQIDLSTDRLVGVEALVRWRHPVSGLIPPDKFIPIAEASGLICDLGKWVLQSACRQMQEWPTFQLQNLSLAVNVSPVQLNHGDFTQLVQEVLEDAMLSPDQLVLEITERVVMQHGDRGVAVLREISELGVRIAIDDFGTGYSSLSYLRVIPANFLKIDRSFVEDLPRDEDAICIAKAVIGMGRSLGLRVVAEGIENKDQAEFLQSISCNEAQGYHYARPMGVEDLESWAFSRTDKRNNISSHPVVAFPIPNGQARSGGSGIDIAMSTSIRRSADQTSMGIADDDALNFLAHVQPPLETSSGVP